MTRSMCCYDGGSLAGPATNIDGFLTIPRTTTELLDFPYRANRVTSVLAASHCAPARSSSLTETPLHSTSPRTVTTACFCWTSLSHTFTPALSNMMAGIMGYFGGRRDPKQSSRDAIVTLRQQLQLIDKKEEYLQKKIDEEMKKARANAVTNKAGES